MSVVVVGLNHRTVPLELLERMTVDAARLPKALHDLVAARANITEAVVLSTCNRTEVYAVAEQFHGGVADVRNFLAELAFLPPRTSPTTSTSTTTPTPSPTSSRWPPGLDSAVVGESEILGQVRAAWERRRDEGAAGPALNLLFRHALEVGKRVRTETGIGRGIASVSQAAVALAAERLGTLEGRRVLVLGAGDMGEGMAAGPGRRRRRPSAGRQPHPGAGRGARRRRSAAGPSACPTCRRARRGRPAAHLHRRHVGDARARPTSSRSWPPVPAAPLLIVDVAVPRDVDPAAADLPGVTLLDMDDLRAFAEAGLAERRREVAAVQDIVDEEVDRYRDEAPAREVGAAGRRPARPGRGGAPGRARPLRGRLAGLDDAAARRGRGAHPGASWPSCCTSPPSGSRTRRAPPGASASPRPCATSSTSTDASRARCALPRHRGAARSPAGRRDHVGRAAAGRPRRRRRRARGRRDHRRPAPRRADLGDRRQGRVRQGGAGRRARRPGRPRRALGQGPAVGDTPPRAWCWPPCPSGATPATRSSAPPSTACRAGAHGGHRLGAPAGPAGRLRPDLTFAGLRGNMHPPGQGARGRRHRRGGRRPRAARAAPTRASPRCSTPSCCCPRSARARSPSSAARRRRRRARRWPPIEHEPSPPGGRRRAGLPRRRSAATATCRPAPTPPSTTAGSPSPGCWPPT